MRELFHNFKFVLLLLLISAGGFVALLINSQYYYAAASAVVVVWLIRRLLEIHRSSIDKIDFLFNALDNDDYTFDFTEFNGSIKERSFNALLNRIKELLTRAKLRTIEQERYYEHIFDRMNCGILILDEARGNIYQANRAMREIVGLHILTHINQISKVSQDLAEEIIQSQPYQSRQATIKKELGDRALSIVASYVTHSERELKVVVVGDLNSALERREVEAWSRLTRVLTHEVMNSLAPITSLSETLITMNDDPQLAQGLSTIYQTNRNLISFVEGYRHFTTVQTPIKSSFEIKPLIDSTISLICPEDIEVSVDVSPTDIMLYADENRVLQVLVNLLKNSVQAIYNNTEKRIEAKVYIREDESVAIEISNNGPMIEPDVVENLFVPFFTTRSNGRGIGLSLSKQIMQLHNGTLLLSCNNPDRVTFSAIFN